jgi:hypothetical protein
VRVTVATSIPVPLTSMVPRFKSGAPSFWVWVAAVTCAGELGDGFDASTTGSGAGPRFALGPPFSGTTGAVPGANGCGGAVASVFVAGGASPGGGPAGVAALPGDPAHPISRVIVAASAGFMV